MILLLFYIQYIYDIVSLLYILILPMLEVKLVYQQNVDITSCLKHILYSTVTVGNYDMGNTIIEF